MYNAVTINQNLVSKFTSDKKVNDFYILFWTIRIGYFGFYLIDCVVYIGLPVTDQTAAVAYSWKLSVFLSCHSRWISVESQVRDYDCILF
jgi:hypothetical protein